MIVTERERERGRDIGRGRSRLHAPGARCGTRSRVPRIAPWAKGRRQTAAPPRCSYALLFYHQQEGGHKLADEVMVKKKGEGGMMKFTSIDRNVEMIDEKG